MIQKQLQNLEYSNYVPDKRARRTREIKPNIVMAKVVFNK